MSCLDDCNVGAACILRPDAASAVCRVSTANPASGAGNVTCICVYGVSAPLGSSDFGMFSASGNSLTCLATHASQGELSPAADLNEYTGGTDYTTFLASSGEYFGIYYTGGGWVKFFGIGSTAAQTRFRNNDRLRLATFAHEMVGNGISQFRYFLPYIRL